MARSSTPASVTLPATPRRTRCRRCSSRPAWKRAARHVEAAGDLRGQRPGSRAEDDRAGERCGRPDDLTEGEGGVGPPDHDPVARDGRLRRPAPRSSPAPVARTGTQIAWARGTAACALPTGTAMTTASVARNAALRSGGMVAWSAVAGSLIPLQRAQPRRPLPRRAAGLPVGARGRIGWMRVVCSGFRPAGDG